MDQAAGTATNAVMKRSIAGKDVGRCYYLPVKDGIFYHEAVPLGSYQFYSVQGHSGIRIGTTFLFGSASSSTSSTPRPAAWW